MRIQVIKAPRNRFASIYYEQTLRSLKTIFSLTFRYVHDFPNISLDPWLGWERSAIAIARPRTNHIKTHVWYIARLKHCMMRLLNCS